MRDRGTSREYPSHPIPGVAAIIFKDSKILLVKRGKEPNKGRWGLPGGVVELGETVEEAIRREIREETRLKIKPIRLVTIFNSIYRDEQGRVRYHYVLFEYLCEYLGGELVAGSDAPEARWVGLHELRSADMLDFTRRFVEGIAAEEGWLPKPTSSKPF